MKAITTAAVLSVFAMGAIAMAEGAATTAPATTPAATTAPATTPAAKDTTAPAAGEKMHKAKKGHKKAK